MMTDSPSKTPLTDAEENFFFYELPPQNSDYNRTRPPGKPKEGFVSSAFARKLELEITRLNELIKQNTP